MKWIEWEPGKSPQPPERRYVLVRVVNDEQPRGAICVGWLRIMDHPDETQTPWFVTAGMLGNVTHYSDSLGDDFEPPGWSPQSFMTRGNRNGP